MQFPFILLFLIHQSRSHFDCDNPVVELRSTSVHQHESEEHRRLKRTPQNIRITRYYDDSYNSLSNKDTITKLVLDPAIQYWQDSLMIKNPLSKPLLIDRSCSGSFSYLNQSTNRLKVCSSSCADSQLCYTTQIPSQFIQKCFTSKFGGGFNEIGTGGEGSPNTDLLLIVTQKTDGCSSNVLAYALACELEYVLDRPVVGLINICPGKIDSGIGLRMAIATLKHETAHVLGLSSNLFAFYRDQSGNPLTPRNSFGIPNLGQKTIGSSWIYQYSDTTVKEYTKTYNYITGPVSKTISYLVTPTIRTEMQSYFKCDAIEGMMLEDYGSASSALSHFDKQYLQNELMTPSISTNSQTSRFTLAILQDSGWYMVNMDKADGYSFAKGLGCDFVTKSCYDYMNIKLNSGQSLSPYCNIPAAVDGLSCTPDMRSQSYCALIDSSSVASSVPSRYKYFSNQNLVSTDPFSEYCPIILVYAFIASGVLTHTGECTDSQNVAVQGTRYDFFNQGFGSDSICVGFDKSTNWYYESCDTSRKPSIQGAGCYQYRCVPNYGLVIVVNTFQYQCKAKGQSIDVTSKNTFLIPHGKLLCPDCSSFCDSTICGSVNSNLDVQCNNVDRLCPGVSSYVVPCSTSNLRVGVVYPVVLVMFGLVLRS